MAGENTPQMPEVPESFDDLADDALRGLHAELMEARASLLAESREEGVSFARVREIHAQIREADASLTRIATAVTERIELSGELENTPEPQGLPEAPTLGEGGDGGSGAAADPAGAAAPLVPAAQTAAVTNEPVPLGAGEFAANRAGDPNAPPTRTPARSRMALVASKGGDLGTVEEPDFAEIAHLVETGKSHEGRTMLAGLGAYEADTAFTSEEMLGRGGVDHTDRQIREAIEDYRFRNPDLFPKAQPVGRTAAICDPLDIIREIPNCVQASEPLVDALPQRPAGRLGFTFTPAMALSVMASGVGSWTEANQAAVSATDQATWKPCVKVECPTPLTTKAEAIAACFFFDITTDMSNPERIQDAMNKIAAYKARLLTGRLLQMVDTLSIHQSATGPYGALPGFVQTLATALAAYKYDERLDDAPYVITIPPGLLELLVTDRANKGFMDQIEREDVLAYVTAELASAGHAVRFVHLADVGLSDPRPFNVLPAVNAPFAALVGLGGVQKFRVRLIAPESALFYKTGEMNTGIERSPELMRRNQAQWFMEEFFGLAKPGCHPWGTLEVTLCNNGTRAGLTSPFACPSST